MLSAIEANKLANLRCFICIDSYLEELDELVRARCLGGCKFAVWDYNASEASATEVNAVRCELQKLGYDVKDEWFNGQLVIHW